MTKPCLFTPGSNGDQVDERPVLSVTFANKEVPMQVKKSFIRTDETQ